MEDVNKNKTLSFEAEQVLYELKKENVMSDLPIELRVKLNQPPGTFIDYGLSSARVTRFEDVYRFLVFAGINSDLEDIVKSFAGKNHEARSLGVKFEPKFETDEGEPLSDSEVNIAVYRDDYGRIGPLFEMVERLLDISGKSLSLDYLSFNFDVTIDGSSLVHEIPTAVFRGLDVRNLSFLEEVGSATKVDYFFRAVGCSNLKSVLCEFNEYGDGGKEFVVRDCPKCILVPEVINASVVKLVNLPLISSPKSLPNCRELVIKGTQIQRLDEHLLLEIRERWDNGELMVVDLDPHLMVQFDALKSERTIDMKISDVAGRVDEVMSTWPIASEIKPWEAGVVSETQQDLDDGGFAANLQFLLEKPMPPQQQEQWHQESGRFRAVTATYDEMPANLQQAMAGYTQVLQQLVEVEGEFFRNAVQRTGEFEVVHEQISIDAAADHLFAFLNNGDTHGSMILERLEARYGELQQSFAWMSEFLNTAFQDFFKIDKRKPTDFLNILGSCQTMQIPRFNFLKSSEVLPNLLEQVYDASGHLNYEVCAKVFEVMNISPGQYSDFEIKAIVNLVSLVMKKIQDNRRFREVGLDVMNIEDGLVHKGAGTVGKGLAGAVPGAKQIGWVSKGLQLAWNKVGGPLWQRFRPRTWEERVDGIVQREEDWKKFNR